MDEDYVQVVDVGAGEAGLDVASDFLEEGVAVVLVETARRIHSLALGARDGLAIGDRPGRIGRPVATIRAEPCHPDTRRALDRLRSRKRKLLRPSALPWAARSDGQLTACQHAHRSRQRRPPG